jgi:hypothetical protein
MRKGVDTLGVREEATGYIGKPRGVVAAVGGPSVFGTRYRRSCGITNLC